MNPGHVLYHLCMSQYFHSVSRSRRSGGVLLLVGVLAGVTVGGGVGVIAASSTKTVTVCADKKTGMLRYAKNGKCAKTETKVLLNQTGADGVAGVTGAKGETGTAGANGTNGTNGANTNSQVKYLCGDNGISACAVGLTGPGGGIVFMTPSTPGNTSGLFYEAAPSTWSSPLGDPLSAWCDNSNDLLGVASTVAGTGAMDGAAKTTVMLGVCTSGAANLADDYTVTINGVVYGDWFLPSKGELNQLDVHRELVGVHYPGGAYWSSSEYDGTLAWYQFLGMGQSKVGKVYGRYVRPVRTF
ncbi:unannotated protein [freshwater metagenome]|uniref:Unannotated protein n=1 Tax=freshwater metagenome TaxID=449393 RepID=A0A6J6AGI3_9ZZZZ